MTEMTTFTARELLTLLLDDLDALIDDSEGVAGLHLNGDIACWESLRQGGRFETWLMRMDEARAFLAQPEPEGPSDGEILSLMVKHNVAYLRDSKYDGPRYLRSRTEERQVFEVVRESLALYASPTIEPVGVTDEEIEREALKNADSDDEYRAFKSGAFFVQERISRPTIEDVPVAERLSELRGMFERILCVARSSGGLTVGNIQLADRLIDAVVSWSGDALPVPGAEVG